MCKNEHDNFIMLPTVDFCFKELMQNPKVRKGFIAAVLGKDPVSIRNTILIPSELRRESPDDKLGILDVMVELDDGSKLNMEMQVPYFEFWTNRVLFYECKVYTGQIKKGEPYETLKPCIHVSILDFIHFPEDKRCYRKIAFCDVETGKQYTNLMELHILELKKLPEEDQNEEGVIRWMRFLSGKTKKEFEDMAKKDEYIEEAYNELKKLSLDEQKRLEYEARERALHDYNTQMNSAERRGKRAALKKLIRKKLDKGMSPEDIAEFLELDTDEVMELAAEKDSESPLHP
ncbi:MAG TPA: Rpn family recombination-promoting nuclease/putative transposase [Candidatus Mediterraneibacter cottocaccae]|nr:Rpn family recombination-promoting nuclease/putative transposase [Candidatus Mediterraneibacter cottocaccae]